MAVGAARLPAPRGQDSADTVNVALTRGRAKMSEPRPPGLATARAAPAVAQPSGSGAVAQLAGALHFGAMRTAEDRAVLLHAVAHDVGAAARACPPPPLHPPFH